VGASREPYLRRLVQNTPIRPNNEIRALWVVRDALTTPEKIDLCIELAVRARFQLLFVQVRGRGDAYYRSSIEPPGPDLEYPIGDFDPLTYLLVAARAAGIAVHAWINVFYVWSNGESEPPPGHVVLRHPEWLITDADGVRMDELSVTRWQERGVEGYFINPRVPEVRKYTAGIVGELISNYPLDGVHLDYIRYPGRDFGYGTLERTEFALDWGVDPLLLDSAPRELAVVLGARAVEVLDSLAVEQRALQVDSMVVAIREAVGDLPLSAAVVPDPDRAKIEMGQDWVKWVHRRLVDFVVPMAYNHRPEELLDWLRVLHNAVGRERMLVGLAIHDGRDRNLGRLINLLRLDSSSGFSIFSYNVLSERRFAVRFLEEAMFSGLEGGQ
jgi:uncharacterized lipoprotein YddW (UPF0748 family)